MSTYVLVHGAWHASWCWERVVPRLQAAGHTVHTPDLPGHGGDPTPHREVTMKSYTDRVCEVIDAAGEPVILVGHSMGGMVITQTAEYRPDRIRTLVYVCAFLLRNGHSRFEGAPRDPDSLMNPDAFTLDEDEVSMTLKDEIAKDLFYGDCSDDDVALVQARLEPQAAAPPATAMRTSDEKFGRVPRVYVECLKDRAITPKMQRQMYSALPCERVLTLTTSHSPFWSAPEELARHLLEVDGLNEDDGQNP